MKVVRVLVVSSLAVLVGCGSILGFVAPQLDVLYQPHPEFPVALLHVQVGESAVRWYLRGSSFSGKPPGAMTARVRVPPDVTLPVRVSLINDAGDTLSTYRDTLLPRRNSDYWVSIYIAAQAPLSVCGTSVGAPLRDVSGQPRSDSMFVMVGGLPRGAIC